MVHCAWVHENRMVQQTRTSRHAAFQTRKADGRHRLASGGSIVLWVGPVRNRAQRSAGSRLNYHLPTAPVLPTLYGPGGARDAFRLAFPARSQRHGFRPGRGGLSATLRVLFLRLDGLGLGARKGFTDPSHIGAGANCFS